MNEEFSNKVLHGSCIEWMKEMESESMDLCVTDPPYKLTSGGCRGGLNISFNKTTKEQKESGNFFEIPKFSEWMGELFRVLKDGSHFYCMTNDKHIKEIIQVAEGVGFKELNILVWDKGMHTPLGYYMKNVEFVVLFRKGRAKKINNMGSKALVSIKGIRGNKIHPSEKPVDLFKHFVENSTKEGEICFDPFLGSGTLAVSAIQSDRKFVGCEVDWEYCEIANDRIKEAKAACQLKD